MSDGGAEGCDIDTGRAACLTVVGTGHGLRPVEADAAEWCAAEILQRRRRRLLSDCDAVHVDSLRFGEREAADDDSPSLRQCSISIGNTGGDVTGAVRNLFALLTRT
jgi:hypothetical protein